MSGKEHKETDKTVTEPKARTLVARQHRGTQPQSSAPHLSASYNLQQHTDNSPYFLPHRHGNVFMSISLQMCILIFHIWY